MRGGCQLAFSWHSSQTDAPADHHMVSMGAYRWNAFAGIRPAA